MPLLSKENENTPEMTCFHHFGIIAARLCSRRVILTCILDIPRCHDHSRETAGAAQRGR